MVIIPCESDGTSHWTQTSEIDGRTYRLTFHWNQRLGQWSLDIADQDDAAILSVQIVADFNLLVGCRDARLPPGALALVDTLGAQEECTFPGLGVRWQLTYYDESDMAA